MDKSSNGNRKGEHIGQMVSSQKMDVNLGEKIRPMSTHRSSVKSVQS